MIEILDSLTDDELALLGCLLAFAAAGTIMSLSYYVGRAVRGNASPRSGGASLPHPPACRATDENDGNRAGDQQVRKAAA